jgi:hypothetical protein
MNCAYCERPLICEACQVAYQPPSAEDYVALSADEATVACPACGEVLVCHWCKAVYDGSSADETTDAHPPTVG